MRIRARVVTVDPRGLGGSTAKHPSPDDATLETMTVGFEGGLIDGTSPASASSEPAGEWIPLSGGATALVVAGRVRRVFPIEAFAAVRRFLGTERSPA